MLLVVAVPVLYVAHLLYKFSTSGPSQSAPKRFGRGAVGFETGSKKVRIPRKFPSDGTASSGLDITMKLTRADAADIAARIRDGEEVSGEEITAALDKIRREELELERLEREAEEKLLRGDDGKPKKKQVFRRRQK